MLFAWSALERDTNRQSDRQIDMQNILRLTKPKEPSTENTLELRIRKLNQIVRNYIISVLAAGISLAFCYMYMKLQKINCCDMYIVGCTLLHCTLSEAQSCGSVHNLLYYLLRTGLTEA